MTSVKDAVKESLVGSSSEPQASHQVKANFLRHARKDDATGEFFMSEDDFINAVAPKHEDYVSSGAHSILLWHCCLAVVRCVIVVHTPANQFFFRLCSIKSSGNTTGSSSASQTVAIPESSPCPTGPPLRTSSPNPTPNMRSRSGCSTPKAPVPSSGRPSRTSIT